MTTNLEAAKAAIGANYPWTDATYAVGLRQVMLDPEGMYVPGRSFDLALAALILFLITSADITEGGYAVSLDRDAMLEARKGLLRKWGIFDPASEPYLISRTNRW